MRNPKHLPEETFERIRPLNLHGHHQRRRGWLNNCNGKHTYRTREEADHKRALLLGMPHVTYPLYVYKCPLCCYWHLTHKAQRKTQ